MGDRRPVMRLFVAVYPPIEVARAMLEALRGLELPEIREALAEQVHMTLQFVGDTDVRQLDEVKESVERAAAGLPAFELRPVGVVSLPARGEPRLVAMKTDAPPELLEIQRRLAAKLARNPRDTQGFAPHLTLCRFTGGAKHVERVEQAVEMEAFRVETVCLMNSKLRPGGAEHVEVARVGLG